MTRLAYLLGDPPIKELGRLRSDRVRQLPAPARQPGILGLASQARRGIGAVRPATWPRLGM